MRKTIITDLLKMTKREGMEDLLDHMDKNGFYTAPCSGRYHLAKAGGLAEHSVNVCDLMMKLKGLLYPELPDDSVIICALLHDLGKMGQYDKPNYIPKMLKGRATKANPNPEPYQSEAEPFMTNPELMYLPHEARSISIIMQFIELTEEEQHAIYYHNGKYTHIGYDLKETPLQMLLHFADLWASRVTENERDMEAD